MLTLYFNERPDARIFTGKSLTLGGSNQVNQLHPDASFGDLSAVIMKNPAAMGRVLPHHRIWISP